MQLVLPTIWWSLQAKEEYQTCPFSVSLCVQTSIELSKMLCRFIMDNTNSSTECKCKCLTQPKWRAHHLQNWCWNLSVLSTLYLQYRISSNSMRIPFACSISGLHGAYIGHARNPDESTIWTACQKQKYCGQKTNPTASRHWKYAELHCNALWDMTSRRQDELYHPNVCQQAGHGHLKAVKPRPTHVLVH